MTTPSPAQHGERRVFAARLAALSEAATFAQDFCQREHIGHPVALRLTLVVEELFTNTVRHGYGGDSDAPIAIALSAAGDEVTLYFEDAAPRFDPLPYMHSPPADLDAPSQARGVGGLGLHLVAQMSTHIRHAYADGNRLWLTLPAVQADRYA